MHCSLTNATQDSSGEKLAFPTPKTTRESDSWNEHCVDKEKESAFFIPLNDEMECVKETGDLVWVFICRLRVSFRAVAKLHPSNGHL